MNKNQTQTLEDFKSMYEGLVYDWIHEKLWEHPNAIPEFKIIENPAKDKYLVPGARGKVIALAIDEDGTVTLLFPKKEYAKHPEITRKALHYPMWKEWFYPPTPICNYSIEYIDTIVQRLGIAHRLPFYAPHLACRWILHI